MTAANAAETQKKIFVSQIRDLETLTSTFLVAQKSIRRTRQNKAFLLLTLTDNTGKIEAKLWDNAEQLNERFNVSDIIRVRAEASTYREQLQLTIRDLTVCSAGDADLRDYLPRSRWRGEALLTQLRSLLETNVRSTAVRSLLLQIIDDPDIAPRLILSPAATQNHHAYLSGLVEHILSMCRVTLRVCEHYHSYYPGLVDSDLVLAGCVLHDLAKLDELSFEGAFHYTDQGNLLGHLVMGVELIDRFSRGIPDFPPDLLLRLKHLVVGHHEKLEYGSPKIPQTVEAMVLHHVDNLDAKVNQLHSLVTKHRAQPNPAAWTARDFSLGRALWLGVEQPEWASPLPAPSELAGPGVSVAPPVAQAVPVRAPEAPQTSVRTAPEAPQTSIRTAPEAPQTPPSPAKPPTKIAQKVAPQASPKPAQAPRIKAAPVKASPIEAAPVETPQAPGAEPSKPASEMKDRFRQTLETLPEPNDDTTGWRPQREAAPPAPPFEVTPPEPLETLSAEDLNSAWPPEQRDTVTPQSSDDEAVTPSPVETPSVGAQILEGEEETPPAPGHLSNSIQGTLDLFGFPVRSGD